LGLPAVGPGHGTLYTGGPAFAAVYFFEKLLSVFFLERFCTSCEAPCIEQLSSVRLADTVILKTKRMQIIAEIRYSSVPEKIVRQLNHVSEGSIES
jgi:hypothetical protein